ncbi:hypothetical protein HPB49_010459 [Dermacentor silvarum]|uniref:Uncharacterized protein n=1 Tax=Dermacentor silvarum TaxID=543639 RepID=A0ACB8DNN8_DERSI|nr:hypothetical protein HPB49_010459 [Dermacentor silvarum]
MVNIVQSHQLCVHRTPKGPGTRGHQSHPTATLNVLLSPEHNLIVASTREAQTADQLLGDFELQADKGKMAAHGHLKQHGEDGCYSVVMVANNETTDTLRQSLQ